MSTLSLTGADTVKINDRNLSDFGDGDFAHVTFPSNLGEVKTGKNGNSIFAQDWKGDNAEMTLRLIRGSADDAFMLGLMAQMKADFSAFTLLKGEFTKRVGDGVGNVKSDVYVLAGGIFYKNVEVKSNAEGDTEQSVSIYTMKYAKAARLIS